MKKNHHSKCAPQISKIHKLSLMSTTSFQGIARSQISSNKIKSMAFGSVQHLLQPHMHGCCQWPNYPKPTPLLHCWKYYRHCCPCLSTEGFRTKIFFSQEIRFAVIPVSERCDPIAQADASSARLLEILSSLLSLSEHSVEGHQGMDSAYLRAFNLYLSYSGTTLRPSSTNWTFDGSEMKNQRSTVIGDADCG